jgi:hypothetical protein
MKHFFTIIILLITSTLFAQQKKGQSNYTNINFVAMQKLHLIQNKIIVIPKGEENNRAPFHFYTEKLLQPSAIGHNDATSFIAFSCRWEEEKVMPKNSQIYIRFSKDNKTWDNWKFIAIDEHNTDGTSKNYSTLSYIDVAYKYYQIKVNTNINGENKEIKSLFLNFFNPDKVVGIIENNITANKILDPQSCPCPLPTFTNRTQWNCPQGQGMAPGVVTNPTVTHLIVHHSDGPNTSTNWNAVILSIWNYHTGTNGWSDIGYNWLITPDGTLYEGRGSNSATANVQGAHFCGFNPATMGTCMVGNYNTVDVTVAAKTKLTAILGWKACQAGIPAEGTILHASSGAVLNRISGHRNGCATDCPGTAFFNTFTQLRTDVTNYIAACGNVTPCNASFNITASGCPSNTITFTPSNVVNGGTAPNYAWYVNNVFIQNGANYILSNATNGTKVYARMTSNATCNPTAINSDTITLNCVIPPVCNASLNITANGCPSNTITFTPSNIVNGGTAPTYAWYVNNIYVQNGANYVLSNATNGTKVYARMTSNASCNPAAINSDTITLNCVIPPVCNASLNITANGCPSNTITFTPTNIVNGGTAPTYAWYVNNVFIQNGANYILSNATNGTKVYARMTSNATCNPTAINSDTITLNCVTPPVCNASLNITANGCPSNTITFTPSNVVNGGTAPTYAWYVNNVFVQNGANYILSNATNGTKVYARMTSNATCNPPAINSDTITLNCINAVIDSTEFLFVAPNPSNGNFYVKLRTNQSAEVQYRIVDMLGKLVFVSNKEMTIGTRVKPFYLTKLPSGIYNLEIYLNGKKTVKKISIQR